MTQKRKKENLERDREEKGRMNFFFKRKSFQRRGIKKEKIVDPY